MNASLDALKPAFRVLLNPLIAIMGNQGFEPRITWTIRTPVEQAKLWRQGRPLSVIKAKIQELDKEGADYLAHCLHVAGPQMGKDKVTNALPGQSWHQFGEAADMALFENGKLIKDGGHNAYLTLAKEAWLLGLTTGIGWGDAGHIQYSKLSKPQYSLKDANELMRLKFLGE